MEIVEVEKYSAEVLSVLNEILPQLSPSFDALGPPDLQAIIESDATTLLMAKEGNKYYGSLTLVMFHIPTGSRAWIEDVVVSESARGKGVGRLLVEHAVELASQSQVKSIDLTSRSTRVAAISLYEKVGFKNRETNVYRYSGAS